MGMMDGVINVKDFGAKGDDGTNDRVAIQNAIHEATNHKDGAVIYFPEGRYVVKGGPLILPRFYAFKTIVFKGAGWMVSTILNNSDPAAAPLMIADPDPTNKNHATGYVFEDLELAVGNDQQVFSWDIIIPGDLPGDSGWPGRRLGAFFHRMVFRAGSGGSSKPLVFIRGGSRTRFSQCFFYGAHKAGGVAVKLLDCGGTSLTECQVVFTKGAFIDVEGGGELVISDCRSEGGLGRPAWKFVNTHLVTLTNLYNEGVNENPAIFYFEGCSEVVLMNPGVATPDTPITGNKMADGIQFIGCENCRIIGGTTGANSFVGMGDGTARMVRVDANSKYIVGEGLRTGAFPPEKDFDIQGQQCCFKVWGSNSAAKHAVKIGDCSL